MAIAVPASAETSGMALPEEHEVPDCHEGAVSYALQPDTAPDQAVSDHKSPDGLGAEETCCRSVPPTDSTDGDGAGQLVEHGEVEQSPEEAKYSGPEVNVES